MGNMLGNMLGDSGSISGNMFDTSNLFDTGNMIGTSNLSVNSIAGEAKNNLIEGMTNPLTTDRGTMNSNAGRLAASYFGVERGELKTVSLIPSSNIFRPRTNTFRPSTNTVRPSIGKPPLNKPNAEGSTNNPIRSNAAIMANYRNRSGPKPLNGGNYKSKKKYKKRKRSKKLY
jgi:hypothetical protein